MGIAPLELLCRRHRAFHLVDPLGPDDNRSRAVLAFGKNPLEIGELDYYAWEWADALFIVLGPYWPTSGRGGEDNWRWTLGAGQYRWLTKTLEESKAELKFVCIHHPVGGKGQPIRGGVEAACPTRLARKSVRVSMGVVKHPPR